MRHLALFFFFNDTATTEIYTLSLHDALPIFPLGEVLHDVAVVVHERRTRPLVADLLVALDLFLERHDPEDQSLRPRRASGDVDVDGDHPVGTHEHRVAVEKRTARDGARAHRYNPLGLGHLLVEAGHA